MAPRNIKYENKEERNYILQITQALHTNRINLSPFTKDFRVWGVIFENNLIYLRVFFEKTCLQTGLLMVTNVISVHRHSPPQTGTRLGFLIPVPGGFKHGILFHSGPGMIRCRTVRRSRLPAQKTVRRWKKKHPFILLVLERDTPCAPTLLVVERDTPSTCTLLAVERDTQCMSRRLAMEMDTVRSA